LSGKGNPREDEVGAENTVRGHVETTEAVEKAGGGYKKPKVKGENGYYASCTKP